MIRLRNEARVWISNTFYLFFISHFADLGPQMISKRKRKSSFEANKHLENIY